MLTSQQVKKELWDAVERDDIDTVRDLLEMGGDVNLHGGSWNFTLLMQACEKNNKSMVDLLLSKGASVNETDDWGFTALMTASYNGQEEIVDHLLNEQDIDVTKKDAWNRRTAIHWAVDRNHVRIVERLLSCAVPVDIIDGGGRTPLWLATFRGCEHTVDMLLQHGANPQYESKDGLSPLSIAKACGHIKVVNMLEESIRLASHPYTKGRISVISQQYEKKIAELQSEVEKMKEELRQSVHESEVMRLRNEIEQKEEEMRCLVSALATASRMATEKFGEGHVTSDESRLSSQPPVRTVDEKVSQKELSDLAEIIQGWWQEFAALLH